MQIKPPDNAEIFETPLLDCWLGEDGILYSVSKIADRTIDNYDKLFEVYKKLSEEGTKKICVVGDITKTRPSEKKVRDYISVELPKYIRAMALVSDSPLGWEIGIIFKSLQESPYPIRMFENLEEAKKWLKEYL